MMFLSWIAGITVAARDDDAADADKSPEDTPETRAQGPPFFVVLSPSQWCSSLPSSWGSPRSSTG